MSDPNVGPSTPLWSGFSDVWCEGMARIYAIRLLRRGLRHVVPAELSACRAGHGIEATGHPLHNLHLHSSRPALVRYILLSTLLPIAALISPLIHGNATTVRVGLTLLLVALNAGMLGAADLAWGFALKRGRSIDSLLVSARRRPSGEPAGDWLVRPVRWALAHRRQVILPLTFSAIPFAVLLAHLDVPRWLSLNSVLLTVALSWSGFLLGNVSWWLIVPPMIVVRMQFISGLTLRWNDPARTPGIRTFSEGYTAAAILLSFAAVGVSVPPLFGVNLLGSVQPYAYGWLVILALFIGLVPHFCLYLIVRSYKLGILDRLSESDDWILASHSPVDIAARLQSRPELRSELDSYNDIAIAPILPFGTPAGVQYAAALIGSFVAFVLH